MILLIDNYDSFSFNLYQYIGEITSDIKVIRNDELSVKEIEDLHPDGIIISPGPGRPEQAGNILDVIVELKGKIPILGVCLGHQAICMAFGGVVTYAKILMHGKQSEVQLDMNCPLFQGIKEITKVARYHSLIAEKENLPKELKITAETSAGEIMAVQHETYPIFGLQFHPESILTPEGKTMIQNFISIC